MTQADTSERRRFHRILFDAPTTIESAGQLYHTTLLDISLKGALAVFLIIGGMTVFTDCGTNITFNYHFNYLDWIIPWDYTTLSKEQKQHSA